MAADAEAQKQFWESVEKRRPPDHPVVAAFVEPKVRLVRETVEKDGGAPRRLLDVGCGNGFFTAPLARWAPTVALDFSGRMLALNPAPAARVAGDASRLPFPDNSFDLVFCSNLLHHLPDPQAAVREMARVSARYVALSEPNRNNPLMSLFALTRKVERGTLKFSRRYLERLAAGADLQTLACRSLGAVLPNKTPGCLLGLFKLVDGRYPLAFYNVLVARKG